MLDNASYVAFRFSSDFRNAMSLLLDGARFAEDAGQPLWDFAVSLDDLYAAGLTANGVRWLICKGHAKHRTNSTKSNKPRGTEARCPKSFRLSRSTLAI